MSVHGYPELHVDGRPFFVHAAEFSYDRIPRDLWSQSLDHYRELGINTIDLRIPWNWHEPREGELDFDGHTNPRRDLRGLLAMIAQKGLRLIARPGPTIGDEWKNGGYPDWLLERADYQMPGADRLTGLYPPAEREERVDAGTGAREWLANATHMRYATEWLGAVAHELAPYSSTKTVHVTPEPGSDSRAGEKPTSGPLLFVMLDDSAALSAARSDAPAYFQYIQDLRAALTMEGIEAQFAITTTHAENGFARSATDSAIGITGEWFLKPTDDSQSADQPNSRLRVGDSDAQTLALLAQSLRLQSDFPALLANFQAGWFTPADDADPAPSSPDNTLLSSRWLMAQGVAGLEYSPLQDGLSPPGYQNAMANREFRWDAALKINGEKQPRARSVERNSQLLDMWGEFLASSHPRAGIGLVDWRGGISQLEGDSREAAESSAGTLPEILRPVERLGLLAGLPMELVDPADQPADLLLRDPVLLLIVPEKLRGKNFLPAKSQAALLEYVRRGGVLICNPDRPTGSQFDEVLHGIAAEPVSDGLSAIRVGNGRIGIWSKDFYSWVDPKETFAATLARPEANWALDELRNAVLQANVRVPVIQSSENRAGLLASELISNEAGGLLGAAGAECSLHPRCSQGLLSVANWDGDQPLSETLNVLLPSADARPVGESDYVELPVELAPRQSLLLPLDVPLCSGDAEAAECNDRVVAAGAELLNVDRDGKTLKLMLYTPSNATVLIKLASVPTKVDLPVLPSERSSNHMIEASEPLGAHHRSNRLPPVIPLDPTIAAGEFPERTLDGKYDKATGIFTVVVPRGTAPNFLRELDVHLNYAPDVPEQKKPAKNHGKGYEYSVADAVRLPLGAGESLPSVPPVVLLDNDHNGQFLLEADNLDDSSLTLQATVDGPLQGTDSFRMSDREDTIETVKLHGAAAVETSRDGLLPGSISLSGGHGGERNSPIEFLMDRGDTPVHYEYDFERSGAKNWVIENSRVRLILLPAADGQLVALVDKQSGINLTTTAGGLREMMRLPGKSPAPLNSALADPMLNVPYSAEWQADKENGAVRMTAHWPADGPLSGEIVKTVRMNGKDGKDVIEVEYQFHQDASKEEAKSGAEAKTGPAVITAFSVPAIARNPDTTKFCWFVSSLNPEAKEGAQAIGAPAAANCATFVAGGDPIVVPADASRLEVRAPGRPILGMEWTSGRVTLEQKTFSARIMLELPHVDSEGGAGPYVVRYTVQQIP